MATPVTLEYMEELATQLPPKEQLRLAAYICEQLSAIPIMPSIRESDEGRVQRERLRLAEELLAECEDMEDDSQGVSDAAEIIRQMRSERIAQICQKGA